MPRRCTILIDDRMWRVACVGTDAVSIQSIQQDEEATLAEKASAAAELILTMDGVGPVMLSLASSDCLSASIVTDDLGRSGRRQAMGYLLEEQLPVSAEDVVADYAEQQGVAIGVCAELIKLAPMVDALEEAGVRVQHICPGALLIAQFMAEQSPSTDALLITNETNPEQADLVEVSNQQPQRWWWLTDEQTVAAQLHRLSEQAGEETPKVLVSGSEGMGLNGLEQIQAELPANTEALALQAEHVLAGDVSPWIDLRRDVLAAPDASERYQKQIGGLIAAGVLLLICLGGAMFWRGMGFEQEAERLRGEQITVFKQAFPDSRVPSGSVLGRMRSELQRLEGIGGQAQRSVAGGDEELYPTSALTHLHDVLTALPTGLRYQISDIRIEPNLVHFDGQAESSVIAEKVAGAVRSAGLYDVDPPSSRALSEFGVSFDVFARPKPRNLEATP